MEWEFQKVSARKIAMTDNYLYEIKWDGIRCMIQTGGGQVHLFSKNKVNISNRFPEVRDALLHLRNKNLLIDGELVALLPDGRPEFLRVMKRFSATRPGTINQLLREIRCKFFAFDLLFDNDDWTKQSLENRRERLLYLLDVARTNQNRVEVNHQFKDGHSLFEQMIKMNMEGVVAKRKQSLYYSSQSWNKIKNRKLSTCTITKVLSKGRKTSVIVHQNGIDRGIVELGISKGMDLHEGKSVLVEHGMISENGHFREPYLKKAGMN